MFKRGNTYWCKFRYNGKVVQKSLDTGNINLARKIEAKIRTQVTEGKYFEKQDGGNITVKALIDKYLNEHSKPNKAPKTYKDDTYFSKKIIQYFGNMTLFQVTPKHIAGFIKKRRSEVKRYGAMNVGDTTINHELRVLRHAYNLAITSWELIDKTPFAKIKIPKGDNKRRRYFSEDEEKRIFEVLPDWLMPIVIIARETGLRLSNIANLSWNQVNFFNKTIIIEKTKNGNPVGIPMTENVFNTLKALNKGRWIDSEYIFGKKGKPFRRWWISKSFKKACGKAKIQDFRFHDLRHDFCSKLVQRGVDLYVVKDLAGHKHISTTQRYAHLSPEKLRSAVKVFNPGYNLATVKKKGSAEIG